MDSKITKYTELIKQNINSWKDIPNQNLKFIRLQGNTNEIYKVYFLDKENKYKDIYPKGVIIRIFGDVGGLIDPKREHKVFMELGKIGGAPQCLAYGGWYRIEELIEEGQHISPHGLQKKYVLLVIKYMAQLHKQLRKIKIERQPPMLQTAIENDDTFKNFEKKSQKKELYNEQDMKFIQEVSTIVNRDEIPFLKSISPSNDRVQLCHNDIHFYNLLLNDQQGKYVVFIDFEYANYNYQAFDIANFISEVPFDYGFDKYPYFDYVYENYLTRNEVQKVLKYYLASFYSSSLEELGELDTMILEEQDNIDAFIEKLNVPAFQAELAQLLEEVLNCRLLAEWYWIQWAVIAAKRSISNKFDYLYFANLRTKTYKRLKAEIMEKRFQEEEEAKCQKENQLIKHQLDQKI